MYVLTSLLFNVLVVYVNRINCDCALSQTKVNCTSVEDVYLHGNEKWQTLFITNTKNIALTSLNKNSLISVPNVKYLKITGLINSIEHGAFDALTNLHLLMFYNNQLDEIKPGLLSNLPIDLLLFSNSGIKYLEPKCFSNLKKLKRLKIIKAYLPVIKVGVFNNLEIQILTLTYSNISLIEDGAFADMDKLQELYLTGNHLKYFDAKRVLGNNPSLLYLHLGKNRITKLTKNMFETLPSLQDIILERNRIETIEDESLNNVKNLSSLYLSSNRLEVIYPDAFPSEGLQNLTDFRVRGNRLTYLSPAVLNRLPKLETLCLLDNPWMCACLDALVNWKVENNVSCLPEDSLYPAGSRPTCIVPLNNEKDCAYGTDYSTDTKELIRKYINELVNYEKIDDFI